MIRVYRPNEPLGFLQQRTLWQKELQETTNQSRPVSVTEFWRRIRQRKAMQGYARLLFAAFQHKCAFCESKPVHVSPLHIEHYRPKSTNAFQIYWDCSLTCFLKTQYHPLYKAAEKIN